MVLVTLIVSDNQVLQSRARLYTVPMGEKRVLSKRIQFSGVKQFPGSFVVMSSFIKVKITACKQTAKCEEHSFQ